MLLKIYLYDDSTGVVTGVVVDIVNTDSVLAMVNSDLGVVATVCFASDIAGFFSFAVFIGRLVIGFQSVTDVYGCKLRKGLDSLGLLPGFVDIF